MHVWTEKEREVPDWVIKHDLVTWPGVDGPRKAWWYKLQMFDLRHCQDPLLYLDLDTVIVQNIDWVWQLDLRYFWTVMDFRRLWKPAQQRINSSMMLWNPRLYNWIWDDFCQQNRAEVFRNMPGDQDYLDRVIPRSHLRFFDQDSIKSWRWQIHDGGINLTTKKPVAPGSGAMMDAATAVVVFHGRPKPHQIQDSWLHQHWR
jgi:hypothetical protein